MNRPEKNYKFIESTISICSKCMKRADAKIISKDNSIYILKNCKDCGEEIELLEEDFEYYLKRNDYTKPGTVSKTQTKLDKGCPFDCGLCTNHEQHTCIGLIEVTNKCDLNCPICYANSGNENFLDIKKIEEMMDFYQDSEFNESEIIQISGGEPTLHPEIIEILELAKNKKFKYVMLNTNGLRISQDFEFVKRLSEIFVGGFEIYLQFDGFNKKTHEHFRGKDLRQIKAKAIENLKKFDIPITIVATIEKGINDNEIGEIVNLGLETSNIRGINFQPICFSGRKKSHDIKNRVTITKILDLIEKQTNKKILKKDFIPLPCDVDRVAINYLYRSGKEFTPLIRGLDVKKYIQLIDNTFNFNADDILRKAKNNFMYCNCIDFLADLRKILPENFDKKEKKDKIRFVNENTFRISVTSFIDKYNFDLKSMQKECVHIITPDLKKIPFSAYNMFYREDNKNILNS